MIWRSIHNLLTSALLKKWKNHVLQNVRIIFLGISKYIYILAVFLNMSPPTSIPINPSRCRANSRSPSLKIFHYYWKSKLPYGLRKTQPLISMLSHTNSAHNHQTYLLTTFSNIICHLRKTSSQWPFLLKFCDQKYLHTSLFNYAY